LVGDLLLIKRLGKGGDVVGKLAELEARVDAIENPPEPEPKKKKAAKKKG
jgi:hypothetical protein